jgi:hypothetical protein
MADSGYSDAVPGPAGPDYPTSAPVSRAASPVDEEARAFLMSQDFRLRELMKAYDNMKVSYANELAHRDHMISLLGAKLTDL